MESIEKIVVDVIRDDDFYPDKNTIFSEEFFIAAKRLGLENQIFFKLRKYLKHTVFALQFDISRKKVYTFLEFINELKSVGEFVLMKGLAVAQKYYGNILARHIGDIDILVSQNEKPKFEKFFLHSGFKKMRESEIKKRYGHSEQFFCGEISVGLHTYLCDRFFAEITFEDVETENTTLKIGRKKVEVRTLKREWDLVELCLHAFQHAFPIRILLDIYKVLISGPDFEKVKKIADTFRIKKIISIAVLSSKKTFGVENKSDNIGFLDDVVSDFISSDFFLLGFRNYLYTLPYTDKIFSLLLARKFPLKKLLTILPYIPKEFIKRLKGFYITTD